MRALGSKMAARVSGRRWWSGAHRVQSVQCARLCFVLSAVGSVLALCHCLAVMPDTAGSRPIAPLWAVPCIASSCSLSPLRVVRSALLRGCAVGPDSCVLGGSFGSHARHIGLRVLSLLCRLCLVLPLAALRVPYVQALLCHGVTWSFGSLREQKKLSIIAVYVDHVTINAHLQTFKTHDVDSNVCRT